MAYRPLPVPNLIQGVSQQSAAQRRMTQQEMQENCINSPVDGAVARPSAETYAVLSSELGSAGWAGSFYHEIKRGTENYLVKVTDGDLRVFNLADGVEATVTRDAPLPGSGSIPYLEYASGSAYQNFAAQSVSDYLFIANKTVTPAMKSDVTATRPNEGIFHFKAGNYLTKYSVAITVGGTTYKYSYKTPDNSVATNANYITTNHLAATFYRAMTGGDTGNKKLPSGWTGGDYDEDEGGIGQEYYGAGGTGSGSSTDLTTLGFGISINGNAIHIWNEDDAFVLDADDGNGNQSIISFQDYIQAFTKLPLNGFGGYVVKVQGDSKSGDDDYYVQYTTTGITGVWEECVAPNTPYIIDPATMPLRLINTGLNAFTLDEAPWGNRVAGDVDSDEDPYFIGSTIKDLMFNDQRLGILSEAAIDWSKTGNAYVYFRSTVQTEVANDPIHFDINANDTPLLSMGIVANETTQLWAQDTQFAVRTSDSAFKTENISIKPATAYQFAEDCRPVAVGQSFYFATEEEQQGTEEVFTTIRDVLYREGKMLGDNDVTAHVPRYVPANVRRMHASDTRSMLAVWSSEDLLSLYVYNYYIEGQDRVQSSWQRWTFPKCGSRIVWFGFRRNVLRILFRDNSENTIYFTRMVLSPRYYDPGGLYHTRLDRRVDETDVTGTPTFNGDLNETTIEFASLPATANNLADFTVVCRESLPDDGYKRGHVFTTVSRSGNSIIVSGDLTTAGLKFYAGLKIASQIELTRPAITVDGEPRLLERVNIGELEVQHAATGYYRVEVLYDGADDPKTYEFEARQLGDPTNQLDIQPVVDGTHRVPVRSKNDDFTATLINDSYLPSQWQSAQWTYEPTTRLEMQGV